MCPATGHGINSLAVPVSGAPCAWAWPDPDCDGTPEFLSFMADCLLQPRGT